MLSSMPGIFSDYKSSSDETLILFLFSNAAVTPSPFMILPEKVPSYICPHPQEGLLCFRIASLIPYSLARLKTCFAPLSKFLVTSFPVFVRTLFLVCSVGSLCVGKPPNCSGHTGIRTSFFANSQTFLLGLLFPSYLHFTPIRQALQSFMKFSELIGFI